MGWGEWDGGGEKGEVVLSRALNCSGRTANERTLAPCEKALQNLSAAVLDMMVNCPGRGAGGSMSALHDVFT